MPYKTLLLSLDCIENEKNVIDETMRLVSKMGADLSVIHINDPSAGKAHMMMDSLPRKTEKDIQDLFRKFGYENEIKDIKIIMVESESYAKEIASATEGMDLLIMGHHPKNVIIAAIMDSTDERVADKVRCPMLLVHL